MGYKHSKEDIIAKGSELIRTNGYHHIGVNDILRACNIPKGSFYNFFSSKEQFALEVLQYYGESSKSMIKQYLSADSDLSPLKRIVSFYTMLIDANTTDAFAGGCLLNNLSQEMGRMSDAIATVANKNFVNWLIVIAHCIEEGQQKGEIRTDFESLELAEYLHAGFFGTFPRMKVTRSNTYMKKWLAMTTTFLKA